MSLNELLAELSRLGVKLWLEEKQLSVGAPKGVMTTTLRNALAEHKAELMSMLHRDEPAGSATRFALECIQPVSRTETLPLSFAQQRLWFVEQMGLAGSAYNISLNRRLSGPLNKSALAQSLDEIIRRHEALRTVFRELNGEPVQVILPPFKIALPIEDLSGLASAAQMAEIERLITVEAAHLFNLSAGPLWQARLLKLDKTEYVLLLTFHHIVSDGWSLTVFGRELSTLYASFATGNPSPLPELPVQYADFAVWQRRLLQGEMLAEQLAYWKTQLKELSSLQLPTDHPHPTVETFRGAAARFQISEAVTATLKELNRQQGVTMFMTLLAAFQVLLYRYTGQKQIAVGSPIANRNRSETKDLIGFFVNVMVLCANMEDNPTFTELLARVQEMTLGAYAHQDLPFEKLVAELQPERDLSRNPLVQVAFALQQPEAVTPELKLRDLAVSLPEFEEIKVRFDLELHIWPSDEGLQGVCLYKTDLFEAKTIERLLGHFQTLLAGIVIDPEQRLSALPLLTEAERRQLLVEWNDTSSKYPQQCIHQIFEAQVAQTPNAVAITFKGQTFTYRELNENANRLAHHLQKFDVGPEVMVAFFLERSPELVTAILAILKAGGAYVPLDTSYPAQRLAFMLTDTGATVLLTQRNLLAQLPEHKAHIICVDGDGQFADNSKQNLVAQTKPDNLAYVMYTSGSTGTPKGVCITHQNVVRLVKDTNFIHFGIREVFLFFAPVSFDASTLELWGPLLNGGRLVIYPPEIPSLVELGNFIKQQGITTLWLTATLFHKMVEEQTESLSRVRQLLAGGEVLSAPHVRSMLEHKPGLTLINGYGPTENTTFTCCYPMQSPEQVGRVVSIGRPIANSRVYILDKHLKPVPIGVPGELFAGGDGVARGYLNRPDLTAKSFIPDPFSQEKNARLYRTGDLARWLPDGKVEFLGRIDGQVKIRGFRVELGEIESYLLEHPKIGEAVVIARWTHSGDKQLAAYLVPDCPEAHRQTLSIPQVRAYLGRRLPDYMIPAAFVVLDSLPLTPAGKVDRRALSAPDTGRPELETAFVAPRSPIEAELADMWAELLGLEQIGVYDNFFDLGGHSLLATRLVSRIRQALRIEFPLQNVFRSPTIAGMARWIQENLGEATRPQVPPIEPAIRDGLLPASFAQQRLWFLEQMGLVGNAYTLPLNLELSGPLNKEALTQSLTEIIRRHEALRTTFREQNGQPVQVVSPPFAVEVTVEDLSRLMPVDQKVESRRLIAAEGAHLFDLSKGLLMRAKLLELAETEHILLLTFHHIVSDGWSVAVFGQELFTLYKAFAAGQSSPLPELPVQYVDFAVWQRERLQGETLAKQLAYWKRQLKELSPLQLPTDHPRPAVETFRGAAGRLRIPKEVTAALKELNRQQEVTMFMTLLAAFQTLLYRYTGQERIAVGSPIANRNWAEIEGLIGFFVNTLVLYTDLGDDPTFVELLDRVQETTLGAYAHQDLPFEKLVAELQPERSLSRNPLFQVAFALQQQEAMLPEFELPNLTARPLEFNEFTVRVDLELHIWPSGEGLQGVCLYKTDLFEAETIERLLGHFQTLLAGIVADPEQRLSALPLLTEAERRQLLVEWNDTKMDYPHQCVHTLFERQAKKTPQAVALTFEEQRMTYQALNERANQLAHYLQRVGVGPETPVGICVERSLEMIVGVLGVLKAGGAYVPLDPAYPQERLAFMVEDAQVPVLLTQKRLLEKLPDHRSQVICLDTDWATITQESTQNPAGDVTPENLAYIIYTSGSTGQPKGTLITHRGLGNLAIAQTQIFKVQPSSIRFAQHLKNRIIEIKVP